MFAQPFSPSIFPPRISSLQQSLSSNTALLISGQFDLFYLTGFDTLTPEERESFLYVSQKSALLLLSSFSTNQKIPGLVKQEMHTRNSFEQQILDQMTADQVEKLIIDPHTLRVSELEKLQEKISLEKIDKEGSSLLQLQKMVKDETEIEAIHTANHVTHQAIQFVHKSLKVGMTEQDVEFLLEDEFRRLGALEVAFPSIVAFGDHTALPHHQPTDRKLKENEAVMIDAGAKWNHYCADVTRTFWFGNSPDPQFVEIENIVKDAYQLVIKSCNLSTTQPSNLQTIQPSPSSTLQPSSPLTIFSAADIDKTARDFIIGKNYGSNFIHTTGHGVGLYIHEQPSLNQRNQTTLMPGMIITVEPGIYLEGKFGYRFENSIVVTKSGLKELL